MVLCGFATVLPRRCDLIFLIFRAQVFAAKVPGLLPCCEMAEGSDDVVVPRIFKLLDEHDASIGKSGYTLVTPEHDGFIQYGMD